MKNSRYLLLANEVDAHGKNSGYTHLADYVPNSSLLKTRREEPQGLPQRLFVKLLTQFTGTLWYRLGSLQVEWQARKMLRAGFNGVVHILWGDQDWGFLDYWARKAGVPLCATFHCCPDTLPEILRFPSRLRRLSAVILMSEVQRPFFLSQGIAPEHIHVLHHGIDCDFFRPQELQKPGPFTVIFVGNYRRNFTRLIEVCRRLAADPGIRVRVVAPSQHREKFKDVPNVDFCSGLNDDDLREAYRSASCLLMTVDAATANNAVLEAMACGLPVVTEDVGGISEYTGHDAAVLCPAGSVDALVAAVLDLRNQPERATRLGILSRARAEELDWPKVGQRTVGLYKEILARYAEGKCVQI
ncbi:glycosyltransferase family 4 protein [Prosthecobacter sp.]|uniref:glycosyltransferase family 4 protein n=1 Tax=Prosthecobacter sp. TaxID=1965333 RepID=UPI002ABCBDBE|nr:glycosyltransferase family 4 protein [Prosthecobacter sp.]MDZ4401091.1 glycosyltransferase family 4 protein [Prosthecobacter sp.]